MQHVTSFIALGLLAIGTIFGAGVQGRFTYRWSGSDSLQAAAAKMNAGLPERAGNWKLLKEQPLEEDVVAMLRCPAHVSRVYVHDLTGDTITMALLLGPVGPIAVHTPEICYSSQDYSLITERAKTALKEESGVDNTFWDVRFKSNTAGGGLLRVMYAWSDGSVWNASAQPRFEYSAGSHLYKIQLAGPTFTRERHDDFDPMMDFLTHFVPQFRAVTVSAAGVPAATH